MYKIPDLTGKTFNQLTVVKRVKGKDKHAAWLCRCTCGKYTTVRGMHLKSGAQKSCGCTRYKRNTKHGMTGTPEYKLMGCNDG